MERNRKNKLTKRETDVFNLIIKGFINKEIACKLGINYGTVRTHIDRMLAKTDSVNTYQLVAVVLINKLNGGKPCKK